MKVRRVYRFSVSLTERETELLCDAVNRYVSVSTKEATPNNRFREDQQAFLQALVGALNEERRPGR